jgi:hypothetical protein
MPLSTDICFVILGVLRVGAEYISSSSGGFVKGTTKVKSSALDEVDIGLSVIVGLRGDCRGIPLSIRDLLLMVELVIEACGLAGVRVVLFAVDFTVDFWGLVLGLIVGVDCWTPARRLVAYGSAVAGLAISGLLGRLTGADIREDVVDPCDAWLPDVISRDIADGSLAVVERAALGRALTELEDEDLTGEKDDCAELGRSGNLSAAAWAAFRCATIASRIDCLPDASPGFAFEVVLAPKLDTEEASDPAFGFLESFSSWPLDLASRLFIILWSVSLVFPG